MVTIKVNCRWLMKNGQCVMSFGYHPPKDCEGCDYKEPCEDEEMEEDETDFDDENEVEF